MAVMFMPNSPSPPRGITFNFKSVFKSLIHLHFLNDSQQPVARIIQHSARPGLAVAHANLALVSTRPPAPGSGRPCGLWKTCGKSALPCARASARKTAGTPGTQRARPRRGRLIQDQQLSVAHISARQSELLPLAPREIHATLKTPAHHLIVPVRQTVDHTFGQALHRGGFHEEPVVKSLDLAKSNVLTNKQVITHVILEDHTDFTAQIVYVILAEVRSVQQDLAFGGIVEPREELDQGSFPSSILAD